MNITMHISGSELNVVPAIHFNHYFAHEVRTICVTPETRPDAVAVELGPEAARCTEGWIRELVSGGSAARRFPVMLGLISNNRMLKASLRERVEQFQRDTGKDLSELPPGTLQQEFGLTNTSLLCLSPTDSIIEGIRSAIEFGLPVYGVDLDEAAEGCYAPVIIQHPHEDDAISEYVARNADFAAVSRDEEVDYRREVVMASRLKALLLRHRRVLFTCGIAHWISIYRLLKNPEIRPATASFFIGKKQFSRVVVHPSIAVQYMDLFPALALEYEKCRAGFTTRTLPPHLNTEMLFNDRLKDAYRKYFKRKKNTGKTEACRTPDLEGTEAFQEYLGNLSLLNFRHTPGLHLIISAAEETMSREFLNAITQTFMDYPWATTKKFPECSAIIPASGQSSVSAVTVLTENRPDKQHDVILRNTLSNRCDESVPDIPYVWKNKKGLEISIGRVDISHVWRPWERLISAMSLRAILKTTTKSEATQAVSFEGSMLEGIDIKTTLRSYSHGYDTVYVRSICQERTANHNPVENFTVVWIFRDTNDENADFSSFYVPTEYIKKHTKNKIQLRKITREHGEKMTAYISHGIEQSEPLTDQSISGKLNSYMNNGIALFHPPSFNDKQLAHWAEVTGYQRNPFCNNLRLDTRSTGDLSLFYKRQHHLMTGKFDWSTTLILMALPFAKQFLTVISPDGYVIDKEVYRRAGKSGIRICSVALGSFSQTVVERLRVCHTAPALMDDPEGIFSPEVEQKIGELQTDYRYELPDLLLHYGNE